ncbi:MAG: hypothetical protein RL208_654 [Pseudomonadota bacterium]
MDSILFLFYCLLNTLMYALLRLFHIQLHSFSTLEIMGYANITSFIILLPYIFLKLKKLSKIFKQQMVLAINPIAAALKVYVVQFISPKNAMVISFTQPIFIVILSVLTIERVFKFSYKQYIYIPLSFLGMLIFIGSDFQKYSFVYAIMFLHVIMKAFAYVHIKKVAKDRYETLCYSVTYFAISGLFFVFKNFQFEMLYNKYILIIALISTVAQIVMIVSYEIATKISLLQNLDYSRIVFTFFWAWLILKEKIHTNQIVGALIIVVSVYLSDLSKFNKVSTTVINKVKHKLSRNRKR